MFVFSTVWEHKLAVNKKKQKKRGVYVNDKQTKTSADKMSHPCLINATRKHLTTHSKGWNF